MHHVDFCGLLIKMSSGTLSSAQKKRRDIQSSLAPLSIKITLMRSIVINPFRLALVSISVFNSLLIYSLISGCIIFPSIFIFTLYKSLYNISFLLGLCYFTSILANSKNLHLYELNLHISLARSFKMLGIKLFRSIKLKWLNLLTVLSV